MGFATKWTRAELLAKCRQELLDPDRRWWLDQELENYLEQWQSTLQDEFEFVWNRGTITTSTSTLTLSSAIPDFMRLDAVYRNAQRLSPRTIGNLDQLVPDWRNVTAGVPAVAYQNDHESVSFWPPPSSTYTYTLEYAAEVTFGGTSTATMDVPAWTKYSAIDYVCYRAFLRHGPNFDLNKALRRKARWLRKLARFRSFYAQRFPAKALTLRFGGRYEKQILEPDPIIYEVTVPGPITLNSEVNEVPSGTVNGVNLIFTLTNAPSPASSLLLFKGGILMIQGTHYTLSSLTITFIDPYQPTTGEDLYANYAYITT